MPQEWSHKYLIQLLHTFFKIASLLKSSKMSVFKKMLDFKGH
jgi:hypothetical protein